jgi:hypothetical protein
MEQRIRDRFAELGSEIHSPEFQTKARDAMVGVLREEMALRNVPDNLAAGLLRLLSMATIPRGPQ